MLHLTPMPNAILKIVALYKDKRKFQVNNLKTLI